jgi:hydroxymethylpyrimidine pyrophosphatase-like HAD family hydrolase
MPSDTLMFAKSGISVAMGNAEDEVKARAKFVTDSYENEGFAKAMEKYVLGGGA